VATLVLTANLNSYFLVLFGVGVIYSCRAIPWYDSTTGQMRFVRLKEIPFMKNISVAVLWGVSPFAVPILLAHANLQQPELMCVGILSATLVLSSLNSTVFCDVLDMEGDRFAGTRTLPIIIGAKPTIAALAALNAIWAAAIVLFGRHVVLDMPHTVLVLALAAFPTLYLLPFWNGWLKRSELKTLCELDLLVFTGGIVALSLL
jgi:4-hydroxybenzoate polyprenyltransferase